MIFGHTDKPLLLSSFQLAYGNYANKNLSLKEKFLTEYTGENEIFLTNYKSVLKEMKNQAGTLSPKCSLFFHTTSSFPRFKLKDSGYKRCIKLEKADIVVYGHKLAKHYTTLSTETDNYWSKRSGMIIETPDNYIYCPDENSYYQEEVCKRYNLPSNSTLWGILTSKGFISEATAKIIYQGKLVIEDGNSAEFLENLYNKTYPAVLDDAELDKDISSKFEDLDEEALKSIEEMLTSEDSAIVDVGLKLLPNYNVLKYKLCISTILSVHSDKCSRSSVWSSTAMKQLKETIQYKEPSTSSFPACLRYVVKQDETYDEVDKELAEKLVAELTNKDLIDYVDTRLKEVIDYYDVDVLTNAK